jgi:Zn finger protein HypA/HybF involved in hydrogenase expression
MFCEKCLHPLEEAYSILSCPRCGAEVTNPKTMSIWKQLQKAIALNKDPPK